MPQQHSTTYYINLIKELALNDFKVRYHGSVLGYFWTLIKPLLLFGVLYVVFSVFMRFPGVENYQLYLLLGIILWNFFAESTAIGLESLVNKSGIITRIYVPRWTIVLASLISSFITLALNLIIFFIFLAVSPVQFSLAMLIAPLFLIELFFISLSVSLILAILYVHFRDLSHIWEVILRIGFWITPIIYPLSMIDPKYYWVFRINPLSTLISHTRNLLILNQVPYLTTHILFIVGITGFTAVSFIIFESFQKDVIEKI